MKLLCLLVASGLYLSIQVALSEDLKLQLQQKKDCKINIDERLLLSIRDNIIVDQNVSNSNYKDTPQFQQGYLYGLNHDYMVKDAWVNFTFNYPIMVIGASLGVHSLGNNIGSFLTSIACASMSGAHAIIIDINKKLVESSESSVIHDGPHSSNLFFDAIPLVIVHANPATNKTAMMERHMEVCPKWAQYPWVSNILSYDIRYDTNSIFETISGHFLLDLNLSMYVYNL